MIIAKPMVAIAKPRRMAFIVLALPKRKRSLNAEAKQKRLRCSVNPAAIARSHNGARIASVRDIISAKIIEATSTTMPARY